MDLYVLAQQAIMNLYEDVDRSAGEALDDLRSLIDEIEILIETLEEDVEEE